MVICLKRKNIKTKEYYTADIEMIQKCWLFECLNSKKMGKKKAAVEAAFEISDTIIIVVL